MNRAETIKRWCVEKVMDTDTGWKIRREHDEIEQSLVRSRNHHFIASVIGNCKNLDTRSLIALAVAQAQEIQNGLILGSVMRAQHEKGHPGAHLNGFDDVLMYRGAPVSQDGNERFYDLLEGHEIEGKFKIPLARHGVSVGPWNLHNLLKALPLYGSERPWQTQSDHQFHILWPMPVIWVTAGNHSFSAGVLNKTGFIESGLDDVLITDISVLYEHVYCDGSGLKRLNDDSEVERLTRSHIPWDVRWGVLFELGRLISMRKGWIEAMDSWCKEGL